VLKEGERVRARLLDVRRLNNTFGFVRVGIVVPKFGFAAVRRNKLKRRLRELARHRLLGVAQSYDLIVRARREAYAATFDGLREDVDRVAQLA
jgi:ribonuclease P protein component